MAASLYRQRWSEQMSFKYTDASTLLRGTSNLECFLDHITPSMQCQFPLKGSFIDVASEEQKVHSENMPFFNLGNLWRSYDEWSAYGAGVPLVLPCGETIVQYYVPYLSALQIYLQPGCSLFSNKRRTGDESDWSDTSDFGSDYELEKGSWRLHKSDQWDSSSCVSSERLSSTSSEQGDRAADLVFEYFEKASPYARAPFATKINELAASFTHLHTLNSSELSPASWFSVAWYPIYRIPMGPTLGDLSTCFLTFHTLYVPSLLQDLSMGSSSKHDTVQMDNSGGLCVLESNKQDQEQWLRNHSAWRIKERTVVELPAFGLASYKLRGPCWWESAGHVDKRYMSLLASSAVEWLRQLGVQHPDFEFFASREGTGVYR